MLIGLIVSGLMEDYNQAICGAIGKKAKDHGDQLVVITGKYLDFDLSRAVAQYYEYQYNSLFSYGETLPFDGLIIEMASVGMFATESRKQEFVDRYKHIPHVYISHEDGVNSNVYLDNASGMAEGLEYLYSAGLRKFVMIGGPEDGADAIARKKVFFNFLNSHQLGMQKSVYQDGDFILDCTDKIKDLLKRNPDAEAIICANDILAKAACNVVKGMGLEVGVDISVMGYDDSVFATLEKPGIASVHSDFEQLGSHAYDLLKETIAGEEKKSESIKTRFVWRESVLKDLVMAELDEGDYYPPIESILNNRTYTEDEHNLQPVREVYWDLMDLLNEVPDCDNDVYRRKVEMLLDRASQTKFVQYANVSKVSDLLRRRCKLYMSREKNEEKSRQLTRLYMKLSTSLMEMINALREQDKDQSCNDLIDMQTFFHEAYNFEYGDDTSYGSVISHLKWFGIKHAYLYMYQDTMYHLEQEHFVVPEEILMKAYLKDGEITIVDSADQLKKTKDILSDPCISWDQHARLTLFPIYHGAALYGILLCDINTDSYEKTGVLVNQLSQAVKMITVLRNHEDILADYEDTMQVLHNNNIELEQLSQSDMLTGLVNRRGFIKKTQELFEAAKQDEEQKARYFVIYYVDMNNLKIINDKYGHEGGDFSLKTIGQILQSYFGERGVAGRIGGDEFACAAKTDDPEEGKNLIQTIYNEFKMFNATSAVDYKVEVSIGCYVRDLSTNVTIEEAIKLADAELYKEKKNRSKDIYKH